MTRIWIIEAPGKRPAFRRALDDAGFVEDRIIATYGRLYDLPEKELGFDAQLISRTDIHCDITWEPKRRTQVIKIIDMLKMADEIILATDNDLEGELIASQSTHLVDIAHKAKTKKPFIYRVNLPAISGDHIRQAYRGKSALSPNKVRAAKARRLLDRLLGYKMHHEDDPWRLSIGRITSPLVHSLKETPPESVVISRKLSNGWSAIVRLNSEQTIHKGTLISILGSLPEPSIAVESSQDMRVGKKPLTGPEALSTCMRTLNHPPQAILDSIQHNYESGKLSYPRTDSRRLGEVAMKWAQRMAHENAISFDPQIALARQGEVLDRSYDAHEALMPLISDVPQASVPIAFLSAQEAVLRVISEHSMYIGAEDELIRCEHGALDSGSSANERWKSALSSWSDQLSIRRDTDSFGYHQDPLRHELSRKPDLVQQSISVWEHSIQQIVVERLMEIGLGRPSTMMILADKTLKNYLSDHGKVNGRGMIMIEKVMQRLPELLIPGVAREIEDVVSEIIVERSIAERLSIAWQILKKDVGQKSTGSPVVITKTIDESVEQDQSDPGVGF